MAINVRRPKTAQLTSQKAGRTPGMETQQAGRTPGAQPRGNAVSARPTNTITPNRGGINPAGHASLRKKLFRSY